jgi:hypothetical protein
MPITTLAVDSESSFYATLKEVSGKASGDVFVMVTTAHEAGKPWCGDCVAAEKLISRLFEDGGALAAQTLVLAPLARATYRQPGHPFKSDAGLALKAVPTLYKWDVEKNVPREERLIEGETYEDLTKVKAFLGLDEKFEL